MNRPTCAVVVLAGLAAGCELVAGIQDKYLTTADASGVVPGPSEGGIGPNDDSTDAGGARADATMPAGEDAPVEPIEAPQIIDAPQDASAPRTDGADSGSVDFTPPDAGTTDPSAPCSGQPTFIFCDDFDTETTVGQGWQWALDSVDGGTSAFFTGAYTSAPRSVQFVVPPALSPHNIVLGQDLGPLTTQVRLAFDLRIDMDSLSTLPETAIAQILGARQGTGLELDYLLRPNQGALLQAYVSQDGGPSVSIVLPVPPLRTWTRIVISYDVSAGIAVYQDGQPVGAYAPGAGAPNDTKVQVGMIYDVGGGSGSLQMEMDNIVVRGH